MSGNSNTEPDEGRGGSWFPALCVAAAAGVVGLCKLQKTDKFFYFHIMKRPVIIKAW